jgi:hypothetical protein
LCNRLRAAIQTIPETLPRRRDRALLLVGLAAALRPRRLAFEQTAQHADGIEFFCRASQGHETQGGLPDRGAPDRHRLDRADRQELDRPCRV